MGIHKASRRPRRLISLGVGFGALLAAAGIVGQLGYFFVNSNVSGSRLLHQQRTAISQHQCTPAAIANPAGIVEAPAVGMQAPVVSGDNSTQLAAAVGYLPTSALPGEPGTTVLAAHDVTWFSHIDRIRPGATVLYLTRCATYVYTAGAHRVVQAGTTVLSGGPNELLLETCWPLNALFLTPQRYLVEATLTAVLGPDQQPPPPAPASQAFTVPVPAAMIAQGFPSPLDTAPLGRLVIAGAAPTWSQSAAPLTAESAVLRLYFAALAAARSVAPTWWHALAPALPFADAAALLGAHISHYDRGLTPTLNVIGGRLSSATYDTEITVSGGRAPGIYRVHASASVRGSELLLTGFSLHPA